MSERDACDVIRLLLSLLPDSEKDGAEWSHCWDELGDDAQAEVKSARYHANKFLEKHQNKKP